MRYTVSKIVFLLVATDQYSTDINNCDTQYVAFNKETIHSLSGFALLSLSPNGFLAASVYEFGHQITSTL